MSRCTLLLAFALLIFGPASSALAATDETFFELRIRPVLADTCFPCHGGKKVSHGLRVDSRDGLLRGGDSGPAIIAGQPDKSLLFQALRHTHPDIKMPPDKKLPDNVIADFAKWVADGAPWPAAVTFRPTGHWAYVPVKEQPLPTDATGWSANPIDRFVLVELTRQRLHPVRQADKQTLIRRAYFDVIGLPPTPAEVAAFVADDAPDAWTRLIDRLLASPHYGERWGRHWMDVVRYADTAGDNADYPIPEARLYRDYLIDSFNADKPYDEFVREQLAGDILAKTGPLEKYAERVIATGFLALSRRYATAPYELWHLTLEDTIETTGRAFMGLTLRCARCHDHKFDPVTREDYYALYGIFASTKFPWAGAEELASMRKPREHFMPLLPPDEAKRRQTAYQQRIQETEAELQRTEKDGPLVQRLAEVKKQQAAKKQELETLTATLPEIQHLKTELAALQKEIDGVNGQLQARLKQLRDELWALRKPGLPTDLPAAYAVEDGTPTDAYIQLRGDVDQHGPVVKRNVPKFLAGGSTFSIPDGGSGRLQLAKWLTRPEHPLTARVMVNRLWQHYFGKGLVTTPSNFGVRGESPSHPELLDWLATRFVENGWSMKAMHRLILQSKTYRLASDCDPANAANDPSNRYYWQHDRRRLDAEAIRDAILVVSGGLDRCRPGPHPFPPFEKWTWTQHAPFKEVYPSNHRSVYLMTQRFQRHPYLALFDGPDTNTSTEQRSTSTVPQQGLFFMNSTFLTEQAERFARRLLTMANTDRERLDLAQQWAWSRPVTTSEIERGLHYLEQYKSQLGASGAPTERQELEAWTSYARILYGANEFVYID